MAGAIIKAIAGFILIGLMGYRNERESIVEPQQKPTKVKTSGAKVTPVGGGEQHHTATRMVQQETVCPPGTVPVSTIPGGGVRTTVAPGGYTGSGLPPV